MLMTNQYVTDRNQTWVQLVSYSTFMTLLPTKNQGGVAKSYLVFNVTYRALNQGGETGNKPPNLFIQIALLPVILSQQSWAAVGDR